VLKISPQQRWTIAYGRNDKVRFAEEIFISIAKSLINKHLLFNKGGTNLEVKVIDNDVEKALKILKNKLSKSGLFKELKVRRAYEKPSVKQKRKSIEAQRRLAKVQRRRKF
jgi:small subunit ribosomal protein S21